MATPKIFELADEVLDHILEQLVHDPERTITIDHRASLSIESFRPLPPPSPEEAKSIDNWRHTCKRFAKVAIHRKFSRIAIRFTEKGFKELLWLAGQDHLAKEVKKFSYMVPLFNLESMMDRSNPATNVANMK
jgi:hypothetical protein